MFTGLIEGVGRIENIKRRRHTVLMEIKADYDLEDTNIGDSISVDGCCLTITSRLGSHFWTELSDETMRVTNLGRLKAGDFVNLERALSIGERLDGHLVQGHVDGVGKINGVKKIENGLELCVKVPHRLSRYIVEKGSIAVEGISLTVNSVKGDEIAFRIIGHTLEKTTLKYRRRKDAVNLEVDIIGKYVEKLRFLEAEEYHKKGRITQEFLKKHGF